MKNLLKEFMEVPLEKTFKEAPKKKMVHIEVTKKVDMVICPMCHPTVIKDTLTALT